MRGVPLSCLMAPIGSKTVTINGSHWKESAPWAGLDFHRAELRSASIWNDDDYHLGVPWMHPCDRVGHIDDPDWWAVYRVRLKRGWKSFVWNGATWCVSKAPPLSYAPARRLLEGEG